MSQERLTSQKHCFSSGSGFFTRFPNNAWLLDTHTTATTNRANKTRLLGIAMSISVPPHTTLILAGFGLHCESATFTNTME